MPLVLKLLLVPSLIALVTLAGRRWGPDLAGWLSAFPIVSGPILLTIALEQGSGFAAIAAANTLPAVLAIAVFSIACARIARRPGVILCLAAALLRGMAGSYYAFAVFCLVLVLLLPGGTLAPAFLVATACALAVQFGVRALRAFATRVRVSSNNVG